MRGVRVLEFSDSTVEAYGTRVLATLGADVVTLEPVEGSALLHRHLDKGKRSVVVGGAHFTAPPGFAQDNWFLGKRPLGS